MYWIDPNQESAISYIVIITLFSTVLIGLVVPGQDFVTIVRLSMSRSRRVGIAAALGVSTGLLFWSLGSLLGLSVLLDSNEGLSRVLRLGGASLLIALGAYAGISAFLATTGRAPEESAVRMTATSRPLLHGWAVGLVSNLSNVKLLVFFGTIFSGLLPHDLDGVEIAIITIVTSALSFGWFTLVALLGSHPRVSRAYQRAGRTMDMVFGLILVVIGVLIVVSSH